MIWNVAMDTEQSLMQSSTEPAFLSRSRSSTQPVIHPSKPRSPSDRRASPYLKTADVVRGKSFAKPLADLLYQPVQGLVAMVISISEIQAAAVIIPEARPPFCPLELPPLLLFQVAICRLQIRRRVNDDEQRFQRVEILKHLR